LGAAISKLKNLDGLFAGRHFDRDVIILCVCGYLRYKLSLRDLVEMMAERGLSLAHTTILRWVRRYTPEFVKRWNHLSPLSGMLSLSIDKVSTFIRGIADSPPICTGSGNGVVGRCVVLQRGSFHTPNCRCISGNAKNVTIP
jgi:hypothetical protein